MKYVELVRATAEDEVRLDGALVAPPDDAPSRAACDGAICLHGVGSNFYASGLFERITPRLLQAGVPVLWANTRGHDLVYTTSTAGKPQRQGAAYERVAHCTRDIRAWSELLAERGCRRLAIIGHSLGAIKGIYALAHEPPPEVQALVAISPARLSYRAFMAADAPGFAETMLRAEKLVEAGEGETLLEVPFPYPLLMTAAGYVDKYGRQERYNIFNFLERVPGRSLYFYGQLELASGSVAFSGQPEQLQQMSTDKAHRDLAIIPGANHIYSDQTEALGEEICKWLSGLPAD